MKSHRSAFLSVALGLAVLGTSACEDKTEVIIPDPSDPISVNLVPDAITLEVGETADFAAVVTGGDDDTPRTVTFSSGNAAVATVSSTGTVTAVGTGTTTITATATADANARDVSTVTVVPAGTGDPTPPSISIKSITTFATNIPVNINNAFGQLDVTLNVDVPPGNEVSSVQVLVRDSATGNEMAVCTQSFSGGDPSLSTDAAAQVEIVCSFDSAQWDNTTGVVTHLNGPKFLSARLVAPDGAILAMVETRIIFNNQNFISATVAGSNGNAISANGPQSVATAGLLWYGGSITVNMVSVNYVPQAPGVNQNLASAAVTLTSSGSGATGLAGCTSTGTLATDPTIGPAQGGAGLGGNIVTGVNAGGFVYGVLSTSLPGCAAATTTQSNAAVAGNVFSVTFPANATMAAGGVSNVEDAFLLAINSVTVGGQPGPTCINPNPVNNPLNLGCPTGPSAPNAGLANPVNIDNLAPRVAQLNIVRPSQYFSFQVPNHAVTATGAVCTAPCARTVDYGVDRQAEAGNALFMAGLTSATLVDVTAGLGILAETAASAGVTAYLFQLVVKDALGNTRSAFAGPVSTTITNAAGALRFGIDQTLPTHTIVGIPDTWVNPATTLQPGAAGANCSTSGVGCNYWSVSFIDTGNPATGGGPSGFQANPVNIRLELVTPAGTTCYTPVPAIATPLAACATIADDGQVTLPIPGTDGYWRITATVTDAAGNVSDPSTIILTLSDYTAPSFAGGVVAPSVITGGTSTAFNAAITDNIELGDLMAYVEFDNGVGGGFFGYPHMLIGDFGPDNVVANSTNPGNVTIDQMPRSLETTTAAGLPTGTVVQVTDINYQIRDIAGYQLRYLQTPWEPQPDPDAGDCPAPPAPPLGASTQNCSVRSLDITVNVLAGMPTPGVLVGSQYTALVTANGMNALYGLFAMQAPSVATICNNVPKVNCTAAMPTATTLSVTLTGQNAVFVTPFTGVRFYYQNQMTGVWEIIGETSGPSVTDDTVLQLRTYTYSMVWDASNLKVRPAGIAPGTSYPVLAVGTNATGDWLVSTPGFVNVQGN